MSKRAGLDLGTNSIGWAVVDAADPQPIVAKGVNIFSEGVKIEKGVESSKAAERTSYRSARRLIARRRKRKQETLAALVQYGMCPLSMEELKQWQQDKKAYPASAEFREWLGSETPHKFDKNLITHVHNPYYYRAKAAEEKLLPFQLGRVFYHLAQRRGFLSNRKDSAKKDDDTGKVKEQIKAISAEMGELTLGQYFYQMQAEGKKVRRTYTSRVEHYEREFYTICNVQGLAEEQVTALKRAIFFQRPLKSQKGLIGKCTLEPDKPRCAVSHPLFEEFRALQFLNSIRITEGGNTRPLHEAERATAYPLFFKKKDASFKFADIAKAIAKKNKGISFNYKDETSVPGAPFSARMQKEFGQDWQAAIAAAMNASPAAKREKSPEEAVTDVWHAIDTYTSDEKLAAWLGKHLGMEKEKAEALAAFRLPEGFASLSLKAIRKILPFLRTGIIYSHAVFIANLDEVVSSPEYQSRNAQAETAAAVREIIEHDLWDRKTVAVVNNYIELLRKKKRENSGFVPPSSPGKEEALAALRAEAGQFNYEKLTEAEREAIYQTIVALYRVQAEQRNPEFLKARRIDEKIITWLEQRFGTDAIQKEKLYHPSDSEIYQPARPAADGKRYLGSPRTASVRNPVVMRTLHQLRKLLNHLLQEGVIDEHTPISVELARGLNDANRRAAIERDNRTREKERVKLKAELEEQFAILFGKGVTPTDTDVEKLELAREQGMICLYTGKQISIATLFGAHPQFDIEHTIPLSISGDDSKVNKTICDMAFNRQIKGNKIPFALANHAEILQRLSDWEKKRDEAEKIFLGYKGGAGSEDKAAKDSRIQKRHYYRMQYEYWREKIKRFTASEFSPRFRNSQLVDTGNITKLALAYLKTVFHDVTPVKGIATERFRKLWGIEQEFTKKQRDTYLHHCIDALTLACITREKYNLLAQMERAEEENDAAGRHRLLLQVKPWQGFTEDVFAAAQEVLVAHSYPDNTFKSARKFKRVRGRLRKKPDGSPVLLTGHSVRGSLHKDTFYGAILRQDEQGNQKRLYVIRKELGKLAEADVSKIVDPVVKAAIEAHIAQYGFASLAKGEETVWLNKEKQVPIRKVRCYAQHITDPIELKQQRDKSAALPRPYKEHYYVANDSNYAMVLYEGVNPKGKTERSFVLISLLEAAGAFRNLRTGKAVQMYPTQQVIMPAKGDPYTLPVMQRNGKDVILQPGINVLLCENSKMEVDWDDAADLKQRLYRVNGLSHSLIQRKYDYGVIVLRHHTEAKPTTELKMADGDFKVGDNKSYRKMNHNQLQAFIEGVDFNILPDGRIVKL